MAVQIDTFTVHFLDKLNVKLNYVLQKIITRPIYKEATTLGGMTQGKTTPSHGNMSVPHVSV